MCVGIWLGHQYGFWVFASVPRVSRVPGVRTCPACSRRAQSVHAAAGPSKTTPEEALGAYLQRHETL